MPLHIMVSSKSSECVPLYCFTPSDKNQKILLVWGTIKTKSILDFSQSLYQMT